MNLAEKGEEKASQNGSQKIGSRWKGGNQENRANDLRRFTEKGGELEGGS